jgi:hypothetical protein
MLKAGAAAVAVVLATAAAAPAVDKADIDKGVTRGVQALRKSQSPKGTWAGGQEAGMTALGALTLLECGVPMDDPAIKQAARYIRENAIKETQTYSLALSILFLDRLGDPVDIALIDSLTVRMLGGQQRGGNWTYNGSNPNPGDADRLTKLVKDAPDPRERTGQPKEEPKKRTVKDLPPEILEQLQALGRNGPPQQTILTGDNSNTQFATLGLWVARRHGLPVETALAAVEAHFRTSQNRDGGWGYQTGSGNESTATMTGAAVLCLAIVDGTISDLKRERDPKAPGVDPTKDVNLAAGLMLLGRAIDHPVAAKRAQGLPAQIPQVGGKTYYFLFTLERICVALSLDTLAGKDWYNWGAEILLANQQLDGTWNGEFQTADTCFALLFLRRANLASDLSASLKGKVSDETTLKVKPGSEKGVTLKALDEKKDTKNPNPASPPPKAIDAKTDQGKIAKEIVESSGVNQQKLIEKYRDEKGVKYTEGLMMAIPHLSGEAKTNARAALADRLRRMTAATLTEYLKDDEPELRIAAAYACANKDSKMHIPQLIEMLRDKDPVVADAVHTALKRWTEKDFGPAANATAEERDKAIAAWQEWWKKQAK